ncbi:DUF6332 family protein [Streptomyces shaanxiensis]|uniref:DUF6332 family protein n=1 Tax=Streptomyces shaanxiensis TaxID=653357 RepID=UPI003CD05F8D
MRPAEPACSAGRTYALCRGALAAIAAAVLFVARVVSVLVRFGRPRADGGGAAQPSQPGRTSPDS